MIQALRTHRVNTLAELRRIESYLAASGSPEATEPMTTACESYYNPLEGRDSDFDRGLLCQFEHVVD